MKWRVRFFVGLRDEGGMKKNTVGYCEVLERECERW